MYFTPKSSLRTKQQQREKMSTRHSLEAKNPEEKSSLPVSGREGGPGRPHLAADSGRGTEVRISS